MGLYKRKGSKYWWAFHTVGGKGRYRSTGVSDKRAAQQIAADMLRQDERRHAGVLTPVMDHAKHPMRDHLEAFATALRARGVVEQYVKDRLFCLQRFLAHADIRSIQEIDAHRAEEFVLAEKEAKLSARTINRRIIALKAFCKWAIESGRLERHPLTNLKALNERLDRRHERRALTPEELDRLVMAAAYRPLQAAQEQRCRVGVSAEEVARLRALGASRAFLYRFVAATGLRRRELKRLRWGDLDLVGGFVNLPAPTTKSRKKQGVPLRADLTAEYIAAKGKSEPQDLVFPRGHLPNLRTFKRDLVAAGIARVTVAEKATGKARRRKRSYDTRDEMGLVVDFHGLRTTFGIHLATQGEHPRTAQVLMRHSKVDVTMERYTDAALLPLREAVERLRVPPAPRLSGPLSGTPAVSVPSGAAACATPPEAEPAESTSEWRTEAHDDAGEMVGVTGLEPVTPSLSSRAPGLATPRWGVGCAIHVPRCASPCARNRRFPTRWLWPTHCFERPSWRATRPR